jgi:hypothetical protein
MYSAQQHPLLAYGEAHSPASGARLPVRRVGKPEDRRVDRAGADGVEADAAAPSSTSAVPWAFASNRPPQSCAGTASNSSGRPGESRRAKPPPLL